MPDTVSVLAKPIRVAESVRMVLPAQGDLQCGFDFRELNLTVKSNLAVQLNLTVRLNLAVALDQRVKLNLTEKPNLTLKLKMVLRLNLAIDST